MSFRKFAVAALILVASLAQAQLYPLGQNVGTLQVPYNSGSGIWGALSVSGSGNIAMTVSPSISTLTLSDITGSSQCLHASTAGLITGTGSDCGSGGGLTSVGLSTTAGFLTVGSSPLTTNGTITINPTSGLTANEVVATPNGSSGAAGLRALVAADVPTLNQSTTGNAATATNLASYPTLCSGGQFSQGLSSGSNNCGTPAGAAVATITETAKTATLAETVLCSTSVCNVAGAQYQVSWSIWGSGTACSSVTAGTVSLNLYWTDENGTAHAAVIMEMMAQTSATATSMAAAFHFETALANEGASGSFVLSSNGAAAIEFGNTYAACTTGTGTYNERLAVTRLQ